MPTPLHILIVDDNQEILDMLRVMLGRQGYKVSTQSRMGDFTAQVTGLQPDIVLMDMKLGWANGCDLCALVKTNKSLQHIPVIMFSAYHKVKEDCVMAGADSFLEKPFEMGELLGTIEKLTGQLSIE